MMVVGVVEGVVNVAVSQSGGFGGSVIGEGCTQCEYCEMIRFVLHNNKRLTTTTSIYTKPPPTKPSKQAALQLKTLPHPEYNLQYSTLG